MADEESKYFSLTEAERLRAQLEPVLIEAMESRRKLGEAEEQLNALAERIQRSGGLLISYEKTARMRLDRNRSEEAVRSALEQIQATGCVVKDLDVGLLDFPARINNQEVYLCWRLGEDRIRFYHRQDKVFRRASPLTRATPATAAQSSKCTARIVCRQLHLRARDQSHRKSLEGFYQPLSSFRGAPAGRLARVGRRSICARASRKQTDPAGYWRGLVPLVPRDRPRELRKSGNRGNN